MSYVNMLVDVTDEKRRIHKCVIKCEGIKE
jgi:hypothetical protein